MKYFHFWIFVFLFSINSCQSVAQDETTNLNIEKVVLDENDKDYGYYLSVHPESKQIDGVLVLFPGFGQRSEDIFLDTKLPEYAAKNNLLTIGFSGRTRMTADSLIQLKLIAVLQDVIAKNEVNPNHFILGGFSAGGIIALRYTELCNEFPDRFPISPKGVFMADSPVDLFHLWSLEQEILDNNTSEVAVSEATWMRKFYREYYGGTPAEKPETFQPLSPFSIDKSLGNNERFLKNVAIRTYHDVDVAWRLIHRSQPVRFNNYVATSELINRLTLMGNEEAEFIQTFQTGYRRNGDRHPHSWSIIDAEECVKWMKGLLMNDE